jgi:hypothetical protein
MEAVEVGTAGTLSAYLSAQFALATLKAITLVCAAEALYTTTANVVFNQDTTGHTSPCSWRGRAREGIFFHYSQFPPTSFVGGLNPPAWVTEVSGLDSRTAMQDLSIDPPLFEYTFKIGLDKLGPANNFNPGRIIQYPVEKPTGPGSMLRWKPVLQTH